MGNLSVEQIYADSIGSEMAFREVDRQLDELRSKIDEQLKSIRNRREALEFRLGGLELNCARRADLDEVYDRLDALELRAAALEDGEPRIMRVVDDIVVLASESERAEAEADERARYEEGDSDGAE